MTIFGRLADSLTAARNAQEEFTEGVASLQREAARKRAERDDVERAPILKAAALERVKAGAARHRSRGVGAMRLRGFTDPTMNAMADLRLDDFSVCSLLADHLETVLTARVEEFYASHGEGISDAERAERLARIDDELLDLELAEESLIRSGEAAGISISRRADADPRAVLAADADLP